MYAYVVAHCYYVLLVVVNLFFPSHVRIKGNEIAYIKRGKV